MKGIKTISAVVFNMAMGALMAVMLGVSPAMGAVTMVTVGSVASLLPLPAGIAREGVYKEIWTGEVVKHLRGRLEGSWLDGIPDQSSIVNNDAINLVEAGVDPDVLINNTEYPIATQKLPDGNIVLKLDKFQTKVTPITDDELYAISYDKMARVKESHGNAISDAKFKKAAFNLCAKKSTADTPVLKTTGERVPATGRLRLVFADLVALKEALDNLGVPAENRRLVLCPDHANDLLLTNQTFALQYNIDRNTGKIGHLAGFDIYEYGQNPLYTTAGVKKDLGVAATTGEFRCSFAFYTPRVFKATGSTKMYFRAAETDPESQMNKVNFRHYFLAMPKKADAGAVMMSDYVAPVQDAGQQPAQGENAGNG